MRATLSPEAAGDGSVVRLEILTVSPPLETLMSLVLSGRTLPTVPH